MAARTINSYDVGETVRITVTFTDSNGTAADPDTVTCKVLDPSGNQSTPSVSTSGTGVYYADVTIDEAGAWVYRFEGTGTLPDAADEHQFLAENTEF